MSRNRSVDDVFDQLASFDKKTLTKTVKQAQREGAKLLRDDVKSRAPVETGATKRSVKVKAGPRRKNQISTEVQAGGGADDVYVGFIEFGTRDTPPNPFIRSAKEAREDDVVSIVYRQINDAIDNAL